MKKLIISILIALSFTSLSFGQSDEKESNRPNFSGVWLLDEKRSKDALREMIENRERRKYKKQKLTVKFTVVLKIVHNDPEMVITGARLKEVFDESGKLVERVPTELRKITLFTDSRLESESPDNKKDVNARSKWKDKTIVRYVPKGSHTPALFDVVSMSAQNRRTVYSLIKQNKELVIEEFSEGTYFQSNRAGLLSISRRIYTLVED